MYRDKKEYSFDPEREIEHICTWIKNYFLYNGPSSKAVIGISGGKDSTVTAALLVRALGKDRVYGVLMPDAVQADINDSIKVCETLGIKYRTIDIGPITTMFRGQFGIAYSKPSVATNTPARIRMAMLYAVAADIGGRVANTCNWSEDFVGYSTKYGDAAGDFAILTNYAVREVVEMGKILANELGIPMNLIVKVPSDGMCGKSDEDNLGFTYETLDKMLLDGIVPDYDIYKNIMERHNRNTHKTSAIRLPAPRALRYRPCYSWEYEEGVAF